VTPTSSILSTIPRFDPELTFISRSGGSIELNTTNPFDNPLINLGCLSTDFDIAAIREGMKSALRFIGAKAWEGYVSSPVSNITTATTDADLEAYARANAAPNYHVVGTASMSSRDANYGVVDPDLLVKGVKHLRVVDASVWVSRGLWLSIDVLI
jgi:choline dehydrogenase